MSDLKIPNNKGYRSFCGIIDKFSEHTSCIFSENQNAQTIINEFSKNLTKSKRKPLEIESDRGAELYPSIFKKFLKLNKTHYYSRCTETKPSIMKRVIRSKRTLLKKPIFIAGKALWIKKLYSVLKTYNDTIHISTNMTPIQASLKKKEKIGFDNPQDKRKKQKPQFELGQVVRTADIKQTLSKGFSTNWLYKLCPITEVIHNTIPSYKNNCLLRRYNENLLTSTKLSVHENWKFIKNLNLIH